MDGFDGNKHKHPTKETQALLSPAKYAKMPGKTSPADTYIYNET